MHCHILWSIGQYPCWWLLSLLRLKPYCPQFWVLSSCWSHPIFILSDEKFYHRSVVVRKVPVSDLMRGLFLPHHWHPFYSLQSLFCIQNIPMPELIRNIASPTFFVGYFHTLCFFRPIFKYAFMSCKGSCFIWIIDNQSMIKNLNWFPEPDISCTVLALGQSFARFTNPQWCAVTVLLFAISKLRSSIIIVSSKCSTPVSTRSKAQLSTTIGIPLLLTELWWVLLQSDGPLRFAICDKQTLFFLGQVAPGLCLLSQFLWGLLTYFLTVLGLITPASVLWWIVPSVITLLTSLCLQQLVFLPFSNCLTVGQICHKVARFSLITHSRSLIFKRLLYRMNMFVTDDSFIFSA